MTSSVTSCPLDVLAQVIVSMVGVETWDMDRLYANLKTSYPYRNLRRTEFNLVLKMLARLHPYDPSWLDTLMQEK